MSTIKLLFNAMSLRERALLTGFIWVGVLIWLSSAMGEFRKIKIDYSATGDKLEDQDFWLSQEATTEARLRDQLQRVDPSKTFSKAKLSEVMSKIARQVASLSENPKSTKFDAKISPNRSRESDIFEVHSVRVTVRNAWIADLIEYNQMIRLEAPYIGLEEVSLQAANARDLRELTAIYRIASFELVKEL